MSIETIRTLIADTLQYGVATSAGDGESVEFQTPNYPIYPDTGKVYVDGVLKTLTADYDLSESLGLVTFVIAPGDGLQVKISCQFSLLTDDQIQAMLDIQSNEDDGANLKLAAADCLDAISRNQALVLKKIKLLDLETDGPSLAAELRKSAETLRKQVFAPEFTESSFDFAEVVTDEAGVKEKIIKDLFRGLV